MYQHFRSFVLLFIAAKSVLSAQDASWTYSGPRGPEGWGALSKEYELCQIGTEQSPINIDKAQVVYGNFPPLEFHYPRIPVHVENTGYTIQVNPDRDAYVVVHGTPYRLLQFHFHQPSEHTINGKQEVMEAHFVHQDPNGRLLVVGALMVLGKEHHQELEKIWSQLPRKTGETCDLSAQFIDLCAFIPKRRAYYHYPGSLTTPPCGEGVQWFVLQDPITISKPQLETYLRMYPGSNRPVMPLNNRKVTSRRD